MSTEVRLPTTRESLLAAVAGFRGGPHEANFARLLALMDARPDVAWEPDEVACPYCGKVIDLTIQGRSDRKTCGNSCRTGLTRRRKANNKAA